MFARVRSCVLMIFHYVMEGLFVLGCAAAIPDSDAIDEHTLSHICKKTPVTPLLLVLSFSGSTDSTVVSVLSLLLLMCVSSMLHRERCGCQGRCSQPHCLVPVRQEIPNPHAGEAVSSSSVIIFWRTVVLMTKL